MPVMSAVGMGVSLSGGENVGSRVMKILVSGGAGYIGSHTVIQLVAAGHDVVIVDNFSNAHPTVLGRMESLTGKPIPLHSFDLTDLDKTEHLFASEDFDGVIHFAGFKAVGESVEKPLEYYENNLGSTFSLVRAMQRHHVPIMVFSSSATVYGTDQAGATEDRATFATNPYGWTKVMQEQILRDVAALEKLATTSEPVNTWNLGSGRGTSVLELLRAFEKAVGRELPYEVVARRPGDVATSYADPSKANAELGWRTQKTVEEMCAD